MSLSVKETPYHNIGVIRTITDGKCRYKATVMNDGTRINEQIEHEDSPLYAPRLTLQDGLFMWDYSLLIDDKPDEVKKITKNMIEMVEFAEQIKAYQ